MIKFTANNFHERAYFTVLSHNNNIAFILIPND